MGTAGRLSHQVVVSRRRTTRRKPVLRHAHHSPVWPSAGDHGRPSDAPDWSPSTLVAPVSHALPGAGMRLASQAGQVTVATVIEAPAAGPELPFSALDMPLAQLTWRDPFHWLALGWYDFTRTPWLGLLYGSCFVAMGWMLLGLFQAAPEYTLALSAGFLLMGPFLCLGLYQASRSLSQGREPRLWTSLTAWRFSGGQLAIFAAVLLILEMLWGRATMIVFAISFDGVPDFNAPWRTFLTDEMLTFIGLYTAVASVFAGLIYAVSVVSMPMIMDRSVDAISAALTSMKLVTTQPGVMLLWGGLIVTLVVLAMLPGFLGLLVVGPVLGHASWHAYCAATLRLPDAPDP